MKKITVVTGSRADYGLLKPLLQEIQESNNLKLFLLVTGNHLSRKIGYTIKEINKDRFPITKKININVSSKKPINTAKSFGKGVIKFSKALSSIKPDILVVLGDRYEMLAAATAALPLKIPVAHIGGGEISQGAIDESIRHALTKLSHLHFPIMEKCADRIKQMGEEEWRINIVGSLSIDDIRNMKLLNKKELEKKLKISFDKEVILFIYHPVTLEYEKTAFQIKNILLALKQINKQIIIIYPNLDTGGEIIINHIRMFAKNNKKVRLFRNLPRKIYLSLLKNVDAMVGNSSGSIVETPYFKLPVVNIGNRQKGRDKSKNIVDTNYRTEIIIKAIETVLYNNKFKNSLKTIKNPYGDESTAKKIVKVLENTNINQRLLMKKFTK